MSRFSSSLQRVSKSVFTFKGDPATYTPKGTGVPIKTTAIVYREVEVFPGGFDSSATGKQIHVAVPSADVSKAKKGDKILVETDQGVERFTVDDYATFGNTHGKTRLVVK